MRVIDFSKFKARDKLTLVCEQCSIEFCRMVGNIKSSQARWNRDLCEKCAKRHGLILAGETVQRRHKGKKLSAIVGETRATEIKALLSAQRLGEKNHNFGGAHQKFAVRTGTYERQYGAEKAATIRQKISKALSGKNNPMFGIPAPKRTGGGISGHYKTFYFRSLLELSFILQLEKQAVRFESCDQCGKFKFNYQFAGALRTYFPDFYLPGTHTIIEVKPARLTKHHVNVLKGDAVLAAGFGFKFISENDITRLHKSDLLALIDSGVVTIDKNKMRMLHV